MSRLLCLRHFVAMAVTLCLCFTALNMSGKSLGSAIKLMKMACEYFVGVFVLFFFFGCAVSLSDGMKCCGKWFPHKKEDSLSNSIRSTC